MSFGRGPVRSKSATRKRHGHSWCVCVGVGTIDGEWVLSMGMSAYRKHHLLAMRAQLVRACLCGGGEEEKVGGSDALCGYECSAKVLQGGSVCTAGRRGWMFVWDRFGTRDALCGCECRPKAPSSGNAGTAGACVFMWGWGGEEGGARGALCGCECI
eukprot:923391-Pelagomonas_calceolata.AAC.2